MNEEDVAATLMRLPEWVNSDTALVRRGRWCSTTFLLATGSLPLYVTVSEGKIAEVVRGPALMRSWRFAIRADAATWNRFWQPMPEPGFHDLLALTRYQRATIEGDLHPLMANLRYFKEVLEAPRRARIAAADAGAAA